MPSCLLPSQEYSLFKNILHIKSTSNSSTCRCYISHQVVLETQVIQSDTITPAQSYGDCTFTVASPTLWTRLPGGIRNAYALENCKSVLKTHVFKAAFKDK